MTAFWNGCLNLYCCNYCCTYCCTSNIQISLLLLCLKLVCRNVHSWIITTWILNTIVYLKNKMFWLCILLPWALQCNVTVVQLYFESGNPKSTLGYMRGCCCQTLELNSTAWIIANFRLSNFCCWLMSSKRRRTISAERRTISAERRWTGDHFNDCRHKWHRGRAIRHAAVLDQGLISLTSAR